MGLSFGALVNAALGGTAAYQSGKREGQADKEKRDQLTAALKRQAEQDARAAQRQTTEDARQATLDAQNTDYHAAQIRNLDSEIANRNTDNAAVQWKRDHPEAQAPIPGSSAYYKMKEEEAKIARKYRSKSEWEVYGPRGSRAGDASNSRGYTPAQRDRAAQDFATRMVEQAHGDPRKAVAYVETNPDLKQQAIGLGLQESHYNAAAFAQNRRKSRGTSATNDDALVDAWLNGTKK